MPGDIQIIAQTQTPADLFRGSRCYITPDFQRPYVWGNREIDELWDDIVALTKTQDSRHFTGVVLLQTAARAGYIDCLKVVDGQQRLTTLQLLLSALRTVYADQDSPAKAEAQNIYNLYLCNRDGVPADQSELAYMIRHSNQNDAIAFRHYIHTQTTDIQSPDSEDQPTLLKPTAKLPLNYSPAISAAHQTLLTKVRHFNRTQDLGSLRDAILHRVTLAVIQADADEPTVYDMFSRLNSSGSPLSSPDLVKAETFRQIAALPQPDDQAKAKDLWTYSESYWQEHHGTGSNSRSNLGHLLHHWLCADAGEFIPDSQTSDGIIAAYRKTTQKNGIAERLASLSSYANAYRKIQTSQLDTYPNFTRDFHAAGYNTAYTLALFCLTELHPEARAAALNHLSSYLMRLALAGPPSASLNKITAQVAGATADQLRKMRGQIPPASQADIIRDQLLNIKGTLSWPDDNAVVSHLSQKPLAESRSHPVITAIAEYLQGSDSDAAIHSNATLEHIMPRSWRSHWPLPDHNNAEQTRRDVINMLGNLTLLHGVPNARANNSGWPQKRHVLNQSDLSINRPLAKLEKWDEDNIRNRSKELAQIACKIWLKPQQGHRLI